MRRTESYKCFAAGCAKSEKIWPRLHSFFQHLDRMHTDENISFLISESDQWYKREVLPGLSASQSVIDSPQIDSHSAVKEASSALQAVIRRNASRDHAKTGPVDCPACRGDNPMKMSRRCCQCKIAHFGLPEFPLECSSCKHLTCGSCDWVCHSCTTHWA